MCTGNRSDRPLRHIVNETSDSGRRTFLSQLSFRACHLDHVKPFSGLCTANLRCRHRRWRQKEAFQNQEGHGAKHVLALTAGEGLVYMRHPDEEVRLAALSSRINRSLRRLATSRGQSGVGRRFGRRRRSRIGDWKAWGRHPDRPGRKTASGSTKTALKVGGGCSRLRSHPAAARSNRSEPRNWVIAGFSQAGADRINGVAKADAAAPWIFRKRSISTRPRPSFAFWSNYRIPASQPMSARRDLGAGDPAGA